MSLPALQIRAFSLGAAAYKRADQCGLYLEIFPNGSKLWPLKDNARALHGIEGNAVTSITSMIFEI